MKLYRVTNKRFADVFTYRGASFDDGARWNSAGHPVIYFALDMGTALVEAANYHPTPRLVPASHCKAIYNVAPDVAIQRLDLQTLPDDWQTMPYPQSTQRIGDEFCNHRKHCSCWYPVSPSASANFPSPSPTRVIRKSVRLPYQIIQPVYSPRMFSGLRA